MTLIAIFLYIDLSYSSFACFVSSYSKPSSFLTSPFIFSILFPYPLLFFTLTIALLRYPTLPRLVLLYVIDGMVHSPFPSLTFKSSLLPFDAYHNRISFHPINTFPTMPPIPKHSSLPLRLFSRPRISLTPLPPSLPLPYGPPPPMSLRPPSTSLTSTNGPFITTSRGTSGLSFLSIKAVLCIPPFFHCSCSLFVFFL